MHLSLMISLVALFVSDVSFFTIFHIVAVYKPKGFATAASHMDGPRADLQVVNAHLFVQICN
jgi:hypothetical protein